MLLGVIADDFTGASDIANTLTKGLPGQGGLRTVQYLGVPSGPVQAGVEAGVVSLKSRSAPATAAVEQSLAALRWLLAQGATQIVFKYCSTFDSTPEGNIGPVSEALAQALGVRGVVVCPAFPGAGRTVYQGHLFVGDALLNESGMEHHPLTPMTDPDIRRWLRRQTKQAIGHVPYPIVMAGSVAISEALRKAAEGGETLVVVDAVDDGDLTAIGRALDDVPLLSGGSGIARALPANFIARGLASGGDIGMTAVRGAEAILAGSCSRATRAQIAHHRSSHPVQMISVDAAMEDRLDIDDLVTFVMENAGKAPLLYSSAEPAEIVAAQHRYGREAVADTLDALFGTIACRLAAAGLRRLVVAGGETSGAVVGALGIESLTVGTEIDAGVPILIAEKPFQMGLALKSGNFGELDFFERALTRIAGEA